ncbi:MAG: protein kinase [Sandaracinaceae bacterium]|nr:protein kinase [Sandaracinaceae bacterium]
MRPSRPPAPPPAPPEDTEFGTYTLRERVGVGGMAEVFLALEPRAAGAPRSVVIKRMLPHIAAEPRSALMFEEEARLGALVEHPNVVRVLGSGTAESKPFLVLEHVPGPDLAALQAALRSEGTGLPLPLALFIARELLAGLHAVHEATDASGAPVGIVHGDVTPSNVLVSVHGDVKLSDFGIAQAKLRHAFPQAAAAGRTKGKLGYLAPEQVRGDASDRRADVFAAAAVAAELVIGTPLFVGGSELAVLLAVREAKVDRLRAFADDMPEGLLEVLLAGLARDPAERIPTAAALRVALDRYAEGPPAQHREELGRIVERVAGIHREVSDEPVTADVVTIEPPLDDYVVIRPNGTALGPLTFAQLVEAVTMGRVRPDDRIRLGSGPPRPLRDIGELAGHLPVDADGGARSARVPMGSAFVDALARRAAQKASGVWICQRGDARKDVYLVDGVPEFVSSNLPSELLGEFLVARGVLERTELDMALAVLPRFDGRLGDTLAALGLIEPVELFQHIAAQVREKLLDLFTWEEGHAEFKADARPAERYFPLSLDPWRLLGDGIQRRLEAGLEHRVFAEHMLDSLGRTRTPIPDGLPEDARFVLQLCREPRPLQEIVDRLESPTDSDVHRPYRAIRVALALDLVRFA